MIRSSASALLCIVGLLSITANATLFDPDWNQQNPIGYTSFDKPRCDATNRALAAFNAKKDYLGTWSEDGNFTDGRKTVQGSWFNAHVPGQTYDDGLTAIVYCQKATPWDNQATFETMANSIICSPGNGMGSGAMTAKFEMIFRDPAFYPKDQSGCGLNFPNGIDKPPASKADQKEFDTHCGCKAAPP